MRNRVKTMRIAKIEMDFEGIILPKGAIFGYDCYTPFYCVDYKMRGMADNGRPIMRINRKRQGRWYGNTEANIVTEAILDLYLDNDELCVISTARKPETKTQDLWKNKATEEVREIHICNRYGFRYYEMPVPKGAIYGRDKYGIFVCENYRVQEEGYDKDGFPVLEVYRPVNNNAMKNCIMWKRKLEASQTTSAIMTMFIIHEDRCVIDYGDQAASIARKQECRCSWDTPMQTCAVFKNQINPRKSTKIVVAVKQSTLEEIAERQREEEERRREERKAKRKGRK